MNKVTVHKSIELTFKVWNLVFWNNIRTEIAKSNGYNYFLDALELAKWQQSFDSMYQLLFNRRNKHIDVLYAIELCDGGFMNPVRDDDVVLHPFGYSIRLR